jgi:serine/threonine protein kinase
MNAEHFQRIERVFHAALKLESAARRELIAAEMPDDLALQKEVEDLVVAAEQGASFLETSLLAAPPRPRPTSSELPRMIGPYRVIRELGRGGMGIVYEAEQSLPRRRVALKLVDSGPGSELASARLLGHEPRILGRLNHPSVATIYDADYTADGQSYFVMELIEGERLDRYVQKHNIPRRERLKLFCKVCDAIQYAHTKSVIHLDLKPSNILVLAPKDPKTQEPQIKVVDFGVAAITGSDTTHTTRPSDTGGVQGTLAYMSPEQRRGEQDLVDGRSDVYALGVILFKLMTDELPYPVEGLPIPEAWRILAEQPPRRPRSVDPSIPRDVETIIRTAAADEPARRYQSVAELAGDVRRYLTDLPITARQPSKFYEWAKFAKRNKGLVGTLAAVLVGLITTSVGTYAGLLRAREAEERARVEANARRELTELLMAGEETQSAVLRRFPLEVLRSAAQQMLNQGRVEEAEQEYARLVEISKRVFQERNWYVAKLQGEWGECLIQLGRYAQAELPLLASYEGLKASYGQEHALTIEAINRLIRLYDVWGKPGQATEWRSRALHASEPYGMYPP